ncbi:unnamed protein product [Debaryomyces tyrocola]|nr:unnamed protein product [Debaryomyces tyrocola]
METGTKIENRFELVQKSDTIFEGVRPLEKFLEQNRSVYGGEFIAQAMYAAWKTVPGEEFTPNSLHAYFLKVGNNGSVIRYEVKKNNDGKNFCNRTVECYQTETDALCVVYMMSFSKKNDRNKLRSDHKSLEEGKFSLDFQKKPNFYFDKYLKKIDNINYIEHTHGFFHHALPPEFFDTTLPPNYKNVSLSDREFGMFFRVSDDLTVAKDVIKSKFLLLSYISDSFYLPSIYRALGHPIGPGMMKDVNISLDHCVNFHDANFDPTQWMFMSWSYDRMVNNRVLVSCFIYTLDGTMVASIRQEGLSFISKETLLGSDAPGIPKL